jgi:hypothetical protein
VPARIPDRGGKDLRLNEALNFQGGQGSAAQQGPHRAGRLGAHATAGSVSILTRLYTAATKVNIHPTRAMPRERVGCSSPTVFLQPKISSTHIRWR